MKAMGTEAMPWLRLEPTVMAASRLIRRVTDARLAPLDLNLSQTVALAVLAETGPITQSQLAERLGMGRAATGWTIDALHERGAVNRVADPTDRRVWLLELTRDGTALHAKALAVDDQLREELRDGLSRDERAQLAHLLLRLVDNAQTAIQRDQEHG
jgi:DNA-binding MarR family transcriptional regulator